MTTIIKRLIIKLMTNRNVCVRFRERKIFTYFNINDKVVFDKVNLSVQYYSIIILYDFQKSEAEFCLE